MHSDAVFPHFASGCCILFQMKLIVLLLSSAACCMAAPLFDDAELTKLWNEFQKVYEKTYASVEEGTIRYADVVGIYVSR